MIGTRLQPCVLERRFVPKTWGGTALRDVVGLSLPGTDIGETWELFDHPDGSSRIRGSGETLRDLMERDPRGLLGHGVRPAPGGYFPVALKFIDATQPTPVEVHEACPPGTRGQRAFGASAGWVVLSRREGARIRCGAAPGATPEDAASVDAPLTVHEPAVGDTFYVPAGTPGSLGPAVVAFAIQQNPGDAKRLDSWRRSSVPDAEQAAAAIRLDGAAETNPPAAADPSWLFRNASFSTQRCVPSGPTTVVTEGTFRTVTVLDGSGHLTDHAADGPSGGLVLERGDTALIPASAQRVRIWPAGEMLALVCGPGVT